MDTNRHEILGSAVRRRQGTAQPLQPKLEGLQPIPAVRSRWAPRPAWTLALLATLATGCSGINASKSISPLDFILPGLMQNCPPTPTVPLPTNPAPLLAQAGRVPFQQP